MSISDAISTPGSNDFTRGLVQQDDSYIDEQDEGKRGTSYLFS